MTNDDEHSKVAMSNQIAESSAAEDEGEGEEEIDVESDLEDDGVDVRIASETSVSNSLAPLQANTFALERRTH